MAVAVVTTCDCVQGAVLLTVGRSYVGNDVTHSMLLDRACACSYRVSNTAPSFTPTIVCVGAQVKPISSILTLTACLPRLPPTITFTWLRAALKVVTAAHGSRLPSGLKADEKGMLRLPGIIPR